MSLSAVIVVYHQMAGHVFLSAFVLVTFFISSQCGLMYFTVRSVSTGRHWHQLVCSPFWLPGCQSVRNRQPPGESHVIKFKSHWETHMNNDLDAFGFFSFLPIFVKISTMNVMWHSWSIFPSALIYFLSNKILCKGLLLCLVCWRADFVRLFSLHLCLPS